MCRLRGGGLSALFPFSRHEVRVRGYAFVLLKLYSSPNDPMGRKASILPEDSQRHGAEYPGTRDPQSALSLLSLHLPAPLDSW